VLLGTHFWGLRSRTVAPVACLCQRVLHSERQNVSVVSFSGYPFAAQCLLCTVPPGCTVTNRSLVHLKHLYVACDSYSSPRYCWHDQLIIVPNASLLRSVRIDSLRTVKIDCSVQRVNVFFGKTVRWQFKAQWYTVPPGSTMKLWIFMYFVSFVQCTAVISVKGMNWTVFVIEIGRVLCEVGTESCVI